MKSSYLAILGLLSCGSAFAQSVSAEENFLNSQEKNVTKIAKGVYQVVEDNGNITRRSFGTDGARYDLADVQKQLNILRSESQKRQLTDVETQSFNDLRHRILDLENVTSGSIASLSTKLSTDTAGGACGVIGQLVALAPSSSAPGAAIAIANQGAGFGPPGLPYTLNANVIFYLNSTKQNITFSETAPTVHASSGRTIAFGYSGPCYAVATASATSPICLSPNNYASVSQSAACQ